MRVTGSNPKRLAVSERERSTNGESVIMPTAGFVWPQPQWISIILWLVRVWLDINSNGDREAGQSFLSVFRSQRP